jgi:hypothetical protein
VDADIKTALARRLGQDPSNLAAKWDDLCHDANLSAWHSVRAALLARGYTLGQMAGWDDGATYQKDVALYWALLNGATASLHAIPAQDFAPLDRRKELAAVTLSNNAGAEITPVASAAGGGVSGGRLDVTNAGKVVDDRRDYSSPNFIW